MAMRPFSAKTRRASAQVMPITFGTVIEDDRRSSRAARAVTEDGESSPSAAPDTSSAVAPAVADRIATSRPGPPPVGFSGLSRSRHRSQADCRVTPSRVAISAQDLPCRRAVRTAISSN